MVKTRVVKVVILILCVICMQPTSVMMQEEGIAVRVVDFVEKNFVRVFLQDCTNIKNFLRLNPEQTSAETSSRLSTVFLVFFGEKNHINFSLSDASNSIPSSSEFNNKIPMTIVIHGHNNHPFSSEISPVIHDLKEINTSNIFALNYEQLMLDNYYAASTHVRFVGEALGQILAKLYFRGIKNVHLIGHSLGAHVSGFAGKIFKKLTGYKIDRITGLDPAGPCFFKTSPQNRLSKSDARFVDVIHTDINTSGFPEQLGHVDFYPNGGDNMPGCLLGTCSHVLSIDYYRASVSYPEIFVATKCDEWSDYKIGYCEDNSKIFMGHWLNSSEENGKYFLETSSKFPYGLENTEIRIK